LSYPKIPDNSRASSPRVRGRVKVAEKLGHQFLGQPQRLVFEATLDARPTILGLVEDKLGVGLRLVAHIKNET
jgi:hypothetical protein